MTLAIVLFTVFFKIHLYLLVYACSIARLADAIGAYRDAFALPPYAEMIAPTTFRYSSANFSLV